MLFRTLNSLVCVVGLILLFSKTSSIWQERNIVNTEIKLRRTNSVHTEGGVSLEVFIDIRGKLSYMKGSIIIWITNHSGSGHKKYHNLYSPCSSNSMQKDVTCQVYSRSRIVVACSKSHKFTIITASTDSISNPIFEKANTVEYNSRT